MSSTILIALIAHAVIGLLIAELCLFVSNQKGLGFTGAHYLLTLVLWPLFMFLYLTSKGKK